MPAAPNPRAMLAPERRDRRVRGVRRSVRALRAPLKKCDQGRKSMRAVARKKEEGEVH